ncbi:MAG: DUF3784 domain-containing protein [Nitrososphaerota archaeon]|jgi:hypothetical protein|nr:DUF3784 domain-containing protein [Nitrososphaerota archaeon]
MSAIFVVFGSIIVLFLVMAAFLLKGKGSFLIAGYNTMSKTEQAKYDEKALCRLTGILLLVFSFIMILWLIGAYYDIVGLFYCGIILMFASLLSFGIYANTSRRIRNKNNLTRQNTVRDGKLEKTTKKVVFVGILIVVITCIFVGVLLVYGYAETTVEISNTHIQIKGMYGVTVDFSDVKNISLINQSMYNIGVGRRVDGFGGFGDSLKGNFKSDDNIAMLLFVQASFSPTIRIERNNEKDIYLSFRSEEKTTQTFNDLMTKIDDINIDVTLIINNNSNKLGV